MPWDLMGTDPNTGLANRLDVSTLSEGPHTIQATVTRKSNPTPVVLTADVNVERTAPLPMNARLAYSLTSDRANLQPLAGVVKDRDLYISLLTDSGLGDPDISRVDMSVNNGGGWFPTNSDGQAPYDLIAQQSSGLASPWRTTSADNGAWTVRATVYRKSQPGVPLYVDAAMVVQHAEAVYPKEKYAPSFYLVTAPTEVFLGAPGQGTTKTGTATRLDSGNRPIDYRIHLPTDQAVDALGGIVVYGARSVEVIGGMIAPSRNWAQWYVEQHPEKFPVVNGIKPLANGDYSVTLGDNTVRIYDGATTSTGAFVTGHYALDNNVRFDYSNRAIAWPNCEIFYMEGVAFGGELYRLFTHDGIEATDNSWVDGKGVTAKSYIRVCDLRGAVKYRLGTGGVTGPSGQRGGTTDYVFAPQETYYEDFRMREQWGQAFVMEPGDKSYNNSRTAFEYHKVFLAKIRGDVMFRTIRSGASFIVPPFPVEFDEVYGVPDYQYLPSAWPNYQADPARPPLNITAYLAKSGDEYQPTLGFDVSRSMKFGEFPAAAPLDGRVYQGVPDMRAWPGGQPNYGKTDGSENDSKAGIGYK